MLQGRDFVAECVLFYYRRMERPKDVLNSSEDMAGAQVFDARMMRKLAVFRGHQADVTCAAWHPWLEDLCVSGSYDGTILHWLVSHPSEPQVEQEETS